jgi:hypothetical protein
MTVRYLGNDTGYLTGEVSGFSQLDQVVHSAGGCLKAQLKPGLICNATLFFDNTDANSSHSITNVTLSSPFQYVSVKPTLPASIESKGTLNLAVEFRAPSAIGDYDFGATIWTS